MDIRVHDRFVGSFSNLGSSLFDNARDRRISAFSMLIIAIMAPCRPKLAKQGDHYVLLNQPHVHGLHSLILSH
jgi:hypothetical protein